MARPPRTVSGPDIARVYGWRSSRARRVRRRTGPWHDLYVPAVVVATALVRDGLLLVAQRTRPQELAGRWELPGGRVEPGESEEAAVVRECAEELGIRVRATGRIGADIAIGVGVLRVHAARLQEGSPEPVAREHAALRWVGPADLDAVDWVDADRTVLRELRDVLESGDRR